MIAHALSVCLSDVLLECIALAGCVFVPYWCPAVMPSSYLRCFYVSVAHQVVASLPPATIRVALGVIANRAEKHRPVVVYCYMSCPVPVLLCSL